ncbi:1-phosphatidylinositol 4,5-bisphosphate phosphodiesterase beta-1, partial [Orchesella cincta]
AKPGVHICKLQKVSVPQFLIEGDKFVKWDEDSGVGSPVTLKVDENGFYLYWTNQNKHNNESVLIILAVFWIFPLEQEVDLLDIATIRDTRTGKGAKVPKDPKLRHIVTMGPTDTLEEKTVTVVSGADFVNISFTNFCCNKKEIAKQWSDELLDIAHNLVQLNSPVTSYLKKMHTRLTILTDKQGKIPIKTITKSFAQNKEDRKRVEKALDAAGLPSGKNDTINPSKFTFEDFFQFYKNMTGRSEVEKVFDVISQNSKKKLMTAEQFMDFVNKGQRDPRLNEILYPYTTPDKAKDLINIYEPNQYNRSKAQMSLDGFLRYLLSDDNSVVSMEKLDLADDMDQPLSHYFINSSHNTYLHASRAARNFSLPLSLSKHRFYIQFPFPWRSIGLVESLTTSNNILQLSLLSYFTGHQLTGKSSVEMYRLSLLSGCRCVELDFWNGRTEEPIIVHGYTLVPEIPAKDVIEAIAESAFKTSDYPVILSFENHCNPKQQAKIAQYCREYFGDMLLETPLESHLLEPGRPLPPPNLLKRRIIIKNKKKHHHGHSKEKPSKKLSKGAAPENGETQPFLSKDDSKDSVDLEDVSASGPEIPEEDISSSSDDDEDSAEPDDLKNLDKSQSDKGTAEKESEASDEISDLVNYIQPVHFYSFESAQSKNKSYEMSSFDERQAMTLLKERPVEFVNYNKTQLARVYPRGTRVDSTNFMPQVFWNAGCQLVALNFQTMDLAMQLNLGLFEFNDRCGYLLKPEFMRRKDRRFDPFAESIVDGIVAGTVSIQVISGQFLSDKRVGTYVEVEMYGLPTDTKRKQFRTKTVQANGINPVFDEEPFVFKKVVLPELACVRIAAYEDSGKLIGHRVVPVSGLRPGYRHIMLRNESGQPLNLPCLFLNIAVKDYVPDGLSELAEALANPIKYQNELDKRAKQLSVFQDDTLCDDSSENSEPTQPTSIQPVPVQPTRPLPGIGLGGSIKRRPLPPGGGSGSSSPNSGTSQHPTSQSSPQPTNMSRLTSIVGPMPPPPLNLGAFSETGARDKQQDAVLFYPEPFEKLFDCKAYRDKRQQLEKKLEDLRKKHEKDRKMPRKSHPAKSVLVKRLSSKNLYVDGMIKKDSFPSTDELLRIQLDREKDIHGKEQEEIYKWMEKMIKETQAKQLKLLSHLEEREKEEVKKWIHSWRKDEYKRLSKLTRDKSELDRMKREVSTLLVDKGVEERAKKTELYEDIRAKLEKSHKDIFRKFEEYKMKESQHIEEEYSLRYSQLLSLSMDSDTCSNGGGSEHTFRGDACHSMH